MRFLAAAAVTRSRSPSQRRAKGGDERGKHMTDPFETLGIEPKYRLDLKQVEARHRELSKALHPDRYVNKTPAERRLALSRAIDVNSAWRMVRDPVGRAEALLRRG